MKSARRAFLIVFAGLYLSQIVRHDDPVTTLVGTLPLAWVALEGLWRLLDPHAPPDGRAAQAARRTGMRRDPKGFSNVP